MLKRCVYLLFVLLLAAPVAAQNNLLADLQAERAKYPDGPIPAATIAKILNAVAWAHRAEGWGMLQKGSGNSCPIAGMFVSCDILIHKPSVTHWDVLNNAEGDGTGTAAADANSESVARIDKYLAEHPIAVACYARLGGVPISCSLK